jgi:hypothetical protein
VGGMPHQAQREPGHCLSRVVAGQAEMASVGLNGASVSCRGGEIPAMSEDYLLDAALEHWDMLLRAYKLHEEHKPIVLFDIQEQRIYVYPYKNFKEELNSGNKASLQDQYERAIATNKIVVFVRDNVNRRLVSFSLDYERGNATGSRSRRKKWRRKK